MIDRPAELIADKGYHSRAVLKGLDGGSWQTRIAEPRGSDAGVVIAMLGGRCTAIGRGCVRGSAKGFRATAEKVERSFELTLDRGGQRRTMGAPAQRPRSATSSMSPATISAW